MLGFIVQSYMGAKLPGTEQPFQRRARSSSRNSASPPRTKAGGEAIGISTSTTSIGGSIGGVSLKKEDSSRLVVVDSPNMTLKSVAHSAFPQ